MLPQSHCGGEEDGRIYMQEGGWTQAMIPIIGVGVEVEYQNVEVN